MVELIAAESQELMRVAPGVLEALLAIGACGATADLLRGWRAAA